MYWVLPFQLQINRVLREAFFTSLESLPVLLTILALGFTALPSVSVAHHEFRQDCKVIKAYTVYFLNKGNKRF